MTRAIDGYVEAGRQYVLQGGTYTEHLHGVDGCGPRMRAMSRAMQWQGVTIYHPDDSTFREIAVLAWDEAGRNGLVAC
jgi:hypothetical protein